MFLGKRLEDGRSARKKSCECSRMYPTNRMKTLGSGEPLLPAFVASGTLFGFYNAGRTRMKRSIVTDSGLWCEAAGEGAL